MQSEINIVFIVGIPRSGTTWLLSILENHPQTLALTPQLLNIKVNDVTKETGLFVRNLSDDEIIEKITGLHNIYGNKLFVEKTPSHVFELDRIKLLFPNSKIILIERNPADVIFSMIQKNPFWKSSPKTLDEAVKLYKQFSQAIKAFNKFDYKVKYEELWKDTLKVTKNIFEYLNLSVETAESIITKTRKGKTLPQELKTVFRKAVPGQGLKNFTNEQIEYIRNKISSEKLRILITNHHLSGFTGSEVLTLTLAKRLAATGNIVTVYSKFINDIHRSDKNIRFVDDLKTIKNEEFDIAHVHHNISAIEVRNYFKKLPIVFYSQGILPFLEQPPHIDCNISKFFAISEEVSQNLENNGIKKDSIILIRNFVETDNLETNLPVNNKPQKALVLSRNIDSEKEKIIKKACEKLNMKLQFVGGRFGEVNNLEVKNKIAEADIVFSLGRGAIEAMMMGRAVIIYDYLGGDGLVTTSNYLEIRKNNFSGRRYKKQFSVDELITEIKKYNKDEIENIKKIITADYSAQNVIRKIENIYKEVIDNYGKATSSYYLQSSIKTVNNIIYETVEASKSFYFNLGKEEAKKNFIENAIPLSENLITQGNNKAARQLLEFLLLQDENNSDVLNNLSVLEIMEKNIEKAFGFIEKVLKLNPHDEIALNNLNYLKTMQINSKVMKSA